MSNIYPLKLPGPQLCDSAAVIAEQAVKDSHFVGRIFYIKKKVGSVDYVSASEAANYKRLGLQIVVNYEDAAANWTASGYAIGKDRGDWCADQLDIIDLADIPVVYLSVDFRPANPDEMNAVMECLRGFQESRLGRRGRGVYGFAPTMREAKARNLADYFWMCGDGNDLFAGGASTGRRNDLTYVNLWQQNNFFDSVAGVQVDVNYVLLPNYGQWGSQGGFLMALTDDQQQELYDNTKWLREQLDVNIWGPDSDLGQNAAGQNYTFRDSFADFRRQVLAKFGGSK